MDSPAKTELVRYRALTVALALAIAVLGAKSFLDAAGFSATSDREQLVFLCGLVLFFLSWTLLRFFFQLGVQIIGRLGQIRERPRPEIAMTLFPSPT